MRGLSCSIHQLVDARQETISKLRASADYLDSIWMRCEAMYGDVDLVKDIQMIVQVMTNSKASRVLVRSDKSVE